MKSIVAIAVVAILSISSQVYAQDNGSAPAGATSTEVPIKLVPWMVSGTVALIGILAVLVWKKQISSPSFIKLFTLAVVAQASLIAMVVGVDKSNDKIIAAVVALIGTTVGYVMGTSREAQDTGHPPKD